MRNKKKNYILPASLIAKITPSSFSAVDKKYECESPNELTLACTISPGRNDLYISTLSFSVARISSFLKVPRNGSFKGKPSTARIASLQNLVFTPVTCELASICLYLLLTDNYIQPNHTLAVTTAPILGKTWLRLSRTILITVS